MAEKHPLPPDSLSFGSYGTEQKRLKLEDKVLQQPGKGHLDPHNAPPSRVVHARAVPDGCTHTLLVNVLSQFGKIGYVTMMPKLRQSLVEFEKIEDAIACVTHCQQHQIFIMDRQVYFNYSTSSEITRSPYGVVPNNTAPDPNEPPENHILLFTIFNPLYPITVDVIRTICTPYGFVQRIVIFRKNGLQVLVEFDSNHSAQRAKQQLDGADIYAGCCTLKIEFARTNKLNVFKNDDMTCDYTVQGQRLQSNFPRVPPMQQQQQQMRPFSTSPYAPQPTNSAPFVGTQAVAGSGSVIMLYGLDRNFNCDHVFNLLCSYGNVLKVKLLVNKPGTAMVHMDSPQGARNAIQYLHGQKIMKQTLELNFSRHSYIADYSQSDTLPDGSPCWKDFSQSRNNRFLTAEGTSKNRIVGPGAIMHFYNSPPDSTEDKLKAVFINVNAPPPKEIRFFSQGSLAKSATGLMEWSDTETALEAFILANHQQVYSQSTQAYTFKLAFSNNTSLEQQHLPGSGSTNSLS
ncbi:PREDICTED: heterogeneous nuclear ribonucleoprotein L-like [Amphimedon queenslandica]|uniref:RRM domain-containing protein n=1 Tax=Amphimedon queenslandica TaxID=400682 RepID=A0A1X7UX04_AMPQE|nr:PREDICTED: heterogeneous nuclear ribonucleoprotein L-like [Amphimedon queenslandica]|eukprot:XP_019851800.1 PREDICTED: heterogeneous nuclear ribonucleoprotein L-like [Amphimedon queenslandica]